MTRIVAQPPNRGRKATSLALRLWASLLALLLVGGSLGQAAHFLLVQHAICAEHGDLLELHDGTERDATQSAGAAEDHDAAAAAPGAEGDHEHCQLLARGQRELALPAAKPPLIVPPPCATGPALLPASVEVGTQLTTLSLAPKTSPPSPAAFG